MTTEIRLLKRDRILNRNESLMLPFGEFSSETGVNEKIYPQALKLAFEKEGLKYKTEKEYPVLTVAFLSKGIGPAYRD